MTPANFCPGACPGCEERTKSQQYGAARLQAQQLQDGQLRLIRNRLAAARASPRPEQYQYAQDVSWLLEQLELAREEARMLREKQHLYLQEVLRPASSECIQPDQSVHSPAGAGAQPPHQRELWRPWPGETPGGQAE